MFAIWECCSPILISELMAKSEVLTTSLKMDSPQRSLTLEWYSSSSKLITNLGDKLMTSMSRCQSWNIYPATILISKIMEVATLDGFTVHTLSEKFLLYDKFRVSKVVSWLFWFSFSSEEVSCSRKEC